MPTVPTVTERVQVWQIEVNGHREDQQHWVVRVVREFDDLHSARQFVKGQTRMLISHHLSRLPVQEREAFVEEFCFRNDQYLKERRFFINRPPIEAIRHALEQDGFSVSTTPTPLAPLTSPLTSLEARA